jgi:site-specific recombinase XerD
MGMQINQDSKVKEWFSIGEFGEGTQLVYTRYFEIFCETVGKTPTELMEESIKEIKEGKLKSERKTVNYIMQYKDYLKKKGIAPKSQQLALACVKSFYKTFDIDLSIRIGRIKNALLLRENQNFLTKDDITKLVTNASTLRDKAIILLMASSGIARTEIINLRIKDITFADSIGIITVRRQKNNVDYFTFCSHETCTAIHNYLDERNRTDKFKVKNNNDFIFVNYRDGNKVKNMTFQFIFRALAFKLNYTNGKNQILCRSHALRKFFSVSLENAGMPKSKIDYLLGHYRNGSDIAYFNPDIEVLKQLYLKYLPYLTFEKEVVVRSFDTTDEKRLAELEAKNEELEKMIKHIVTAISEGKAPSGIFFDDKNKKLILKQ